MEDRFATGLEDVWSALTDPSRLSQWYGKVEGDLRLGGEYRAYLFATGSEINGRVEACEPSGRRRVTVRETDESWRKGQGASPFDERIEATLTADGDHTVLVIEVRGMSVELLFAYGTGWQIHVEDLGAHLARRERGDALRDGPSCSLPMRRQPRTSTSLSLSPGMAAGGSFFMKKVPLSWEDRACLRTSPHQSKGTSDVKNTARRPRLLVSDDGKGLVSHAGGIQLTRAAVVTGLQEGLSAGLRGWRAPRAVHDPGKMITDLAVTLALGGDSSQTPRCCGRTRAWALAGSAAPGADGGLVPVDTAGVNGSCD
jgi:uncharacterized protein YndB with AHSA1/START domain